jgi:hypothetical protein
MDLADFGDSDDLLHRGLWVSVLKVVKDGVVK